MSCFKIGAKTLRISLGHTFHPIELKPSCVSLCFLFTMTPKQGQPPRPPPPTGDEEEKCISNKDVRAMMKAMIELLTKNQQSIDTTLEWVERSIGGIIDRVDALETGLPPTDQAKLPDDTHEDDYDEEEEV
jgi:hypothetical protein